MSIKCLKCGYQRKPGDLAPDYECPNCGAIYIKVEAALKKQKAQQVTRTDKMDVCTYREKSGITIKKILIVMAIIIIAGISWLKFRTNSTEPMTTKTVTSEEHQTAQKKKPASQSCVAKFIGINPGESKTVTLSFPIYNLINFGFNNDVDSFLVKDTAQKNWDVEVREIDVQFFNYNLWIVDHKKKVHSRGQNNSKNWCNLYLPIETNEGFTYGNVRNGEESAKWVLSFPVADNYICTPPNVIGTLDKNKITELFEKGICYGMTESDKEAFGDIAENIEQVDAVADIVQVEVVVTLSDDFKQNDNAMSVTYLVPVYEQIAHRNLSAYDEFKIPIAIKHNFNGKSRYFLMIPQYDIDCVKKPSPLFNERFEHAVF